MKNVKAIILFGGDNFWSNGIHLNLIENSKFPADESWENINAINDLCKIIIEDVDHLTVSVMSGNASAGGVFFALSSDLVFAKKGIILNPHYKNMGNLYGSEYWTYSLHRRVDEKDIEILLANRLPISSHYAKKIVLIDEIIEASQNFEEVIIDKIKNLVNSSDFYSFLDNK